MIKLLKSNKIICLLLIGVCIIFIINPSVYAKSCLNAVSVWAFSVLPVLFPFFILTKLIVNLNDPKENFLDKFFSKAFHTPAPSASIYFLSIISGYPMGAKLICDAHASNQINREDAKKMMSFCSVSGPMFIIGTAGVAFLCSYKAGVIILIANIIASLINGLIFRGKKSESTKPIYSAREKSNVLSESVYDALNSILMVGAYIVLSFLIIDVLKNLGVTTFLSNTISSVTRNNNTGDVVASIFNGMIEMTRGILDLSKTEISLVMKTIISSGLIGFGGISVMLQSFTFLNQLKIPAKYFIKQKLTQGILCVLISIPLALLFL